MSKRTWNELGDEEVKNERDVLIVEYNVTNMVNQKIRSSYTHVIFANGSKATMIYSNDSDGSSATPPSYTDGYLTPAECLEAEMHHSAVTAAEYMDIS